MGAGLKTIGASAFEGCSSLKSVVIPDSIITIGESAFLGCTGLRSTHVPQYYQRAGNSPFDVDFDERNRSITDALISMMGRVSPRFRFEPYMMSRIADFSGLVVTDRVRGHRVKQTARALKMRDDAIRLATAVARADAARARWG